MKDQGAAKLPYKPAMFRRGLALVLIPIAVGICVTLFLNQLWQTAENAVKQEQEQSIFIQNLNLIFDHWADLSLCLLARTMESDPSFEGRIRTNSLNVRREFAELEKMKSLENGGRRRRLTRLEGLLQQELALFGGIARLQTGDDSEMLAKVSRMPKVLSRTFVIRTDVRKLLNEETLELIAFRQKEAQSRQTLKRVAYGAALGNVALAVLLVVLFSRVLNRRMRILTENASRIPKAEALTQHLSGDDELAYLDKVISETAEKLAEAAEHRRSIFGMVAHDMRSPLMAAQASLQMILETDQANLPTGKKQLESGENCLAGILVHVQSLLTVEKSKADTSEREHLAEAEILSGTEMPAENPSFPQYTELPQVPAVLENKTAKFPLISAACDLVLRPKIFHQFLLLVMVPLAVQICVLLSMNQQISKMEELADRARRYSDIIIHGRIAQMDLVRTIAAKGIYLITGVESMRKLAMKTYQQGTDEFNKVAALCVDDREWNGAIKDFREMTFHKVDEILKLTRNDSPGTITEVLNRTGEIREDTPQAAVVRKRSKLIYARDKVRLQEMESEQLEANQRLSEMILASLAANLVMAIGVLSLFTSNLSRRLQILVDNAVSLGRREDLKRAVRGTDELAFLDLILHQAKVQLDTASRQRTEFMTSLADDMRHPLKEAQEHLHQFEQGEVGALSERSGKQLARAQSNISRVLDLVDDLLTMETLETGKVDLEKSKCDLSQIADEALATVSSLARRKGIQLANNCARLEVHADRARIAQVLINYLANAIKFSAADTTVRVASEERPGIVRVSVADQGPGMDEDTRKRVFEKFFQAASAEKKQGFGLGLAICSLIVESHNGRLGVESEPGKGSVFWFEIPLEGAK